MGTTLAKCLPKEVKIAIADTIPERQDLLKMAERIAAFEESLAEEKAKRDAEKAQKIELKQLLMARKSFERLRRSVL